MGLIIVFVAAAAACITLYLAFAPFLASKSDQARVDLLDDEIRQVELLAAKKAALLLSLRELEFDHQTDKISDEDYERFRKRYERQAVGVMRELDAIHGGRGWQETIEAEVYARLAEVGLGAEPEVEPEVDPPGSFDCSHCSAPVLITERFCSACGGAVAKPSEKESPASATPQPTQLSCSGCDGLVRFDDKFCSQCGTLVAVTAAVSEATA